MEDKQLNPQEQTAETVETSLEADSVSESGLSEEELQNKILEDSDLSGFQKAIAKLDDRKWLLCQRLAGAVLGAIAAVALFWRTDSGSSSYSFIIAICVAMFIPNIIERKGLRKAPQLRVALAITLGVAIVAFFLYMGIQNGFNFKA